MTAQFNEYERLNKDRFSTWRKYSITARGRFEVLADYRPWTQDHRMDGVPKLPRLATAAEYNDKPYQLLRTTDPQEWPEGALSTQHPKVRASIP